MLMLVVLAVACLLVVFAALTQGRLHIENVIDLSRDKKPVTFYVTLGLATAFILLVIAAFGYEFMSGFGSRAE
ncbi:MAG: hypothetical protein JF571_03805 [Asticcacaulis sp.]|nr:hypothetical protein [Asticcacaulis sp.]